MTSVLVDLPAQVRPEAAGGGLRGGQAWPESPLPPLWPAGEIIQVRETVTPGTPLYTLLLPGQGAQVRPACGQWWRG